MRRTPLRRNTPLRAAVAVMGTKTKGRRFVTSDQKRRILERDDYTCYLCGFPIAATASIDHVVPYAKGGRTDDDNLKATHAACNRRKGNMPVEEFRERVRASRG